MVVDLLPELPCQPLQWRCENLMAGGQYHARTCFLNPDFNRQVSVLRFVCADFNDPEITQIENQPPARFGHMRAFLNHEQHGNSACNTW